MLSPSPTERSDMDLGRDGSRGSDTGEFEREL